MFSPQHHPRQELREFIDIRSAPVGLPDPAVQRLVERIRQELVQSVEERDWWRAAKFASALRDWRFDEPVCIRCRLFCYVSSVDYAVCPKTAEAISRLAATGATPEELFSDKDI